MTKSITITEEMLKEKEKEMSNIENPVEIKFNDVEYVRKDSIVDTVDNSTKEHPYELGANYCVRTVTMIQTGRLIQVFDGELVLADAAWIADAGRFHRFLRGEEVGEVEPYAEPCIVNRGAIVDATKLPKLFLEAK